MLMGACSAEDNCMSDRDFAIERYFTATRLTETVVALRRIREEFALEIRNLANSWTRDRAPSPSSPFAIRSSFSTASVEGGVSPSGPGIGYSGHCYRALGLAGAK